MKTNIKPVTATKGEETLQFPSITECAKSLGCTASQISLSIKKNWKVRGYNIAKQ